MNYLTDVIEEVNGTYSLIIFYPQFLNKSETKNILQKLDEMDDFKSGYCFGKEIKRQQKWFSLNDKSLNDKWINADYDRWKYFKYDQWLISLQNKIFEKLNMDLEFMFENLELSKFNFNNVLINKYRDGSDFIRPHRDSEYLFGDNPTIVSLSVGGQREFMMKRVFYDINNPRKLKENKQEKYLNKKFNLGDGSLLIMAGSTQKFYSHEILKSTNNDVRYNFTFRNFQ